MVLNIGELKAGHDDHVRADIKQLPTSRMQKVAF